MSSLLLVRHAQASFLSDDYDQLSELGREQARLLGQEWARLGWRLDAVFSGPRRRQIHTAEIVGETMRDLGFEWPEVAILEELDEYPAEELMQGALQQVVASEPEVAQLVQALSIARDKRERARAFDRVVQAVLRRWARSELAVESAERWSEFRERVTLALARAMRVETAGCRVAAFSSGGAIGVAIGQVLGVDSEKALELGWTLNNCGVTELLFSGQRVSLSRFNVLSHLADPARWTYR